MIIGVSLSSRKRIRIGMLLLCGTIFDFQGRTNIDFHHIHASEKNNGCKYCKSALMEFWILEVVIVELDICISRH